MKKPLNTKPRMARNFAHFAADLISTFAGLFKIIQSDETSSMEFYFME
jgi:hypothetical protein